MRKSLCLILRARQTLSRAREGQRREEKNRREWGQRRCGGGSGGNEREGKTSKGG